MFAYHPVRMDLYVVYIRTVKDMKACSYVRFCSALQHLYAWGGIPPGREHSKRIKSTNFSCRLMFLVQSSPLHGMASFARFKHWQDLPPFTFLIMLWAEPGGGRFEGFKTLSLSPKKNDATYATQCNRAASASRPLGHLSYLAWNAVNENWRNWAGQLPRRGCSPAFFGSPLPM